MKTFIVAWKGARTGLAMIGCAFVVNLALAEPTPVAAPTPPTATAKVITIPSGSGKNKTIKIEAIEPSRSGESAKEVAWLGVSTEEVPEALASQLGLKPGQGLVVVYVAPESPAAQAGIQKHDVLVEFGDQLLVDPSQLRKLVQMRKDGDAVKLNLHRGGKKQTVSATLAKRTEQAGMWIEDAALENGLPGVRVALTGPNGGLALHELKTLHGTLAQADAERRSVSIEVQRSMEEVRKALQESMRHSAQANRALSPMSKDLEALARGKVDVENDATVTVKKGNASVQTIVKSDEGGVIVIVANPKKRLTAHDKDGKLLFDGAIETQEQQEKVPAELWEKVKPMLEDIKPTEETGPRPRAESESDAKS